jgi:hypothetical protein
MIRVLPSPTPICPPGSCSVTSVVPFSLPQAEQILVLGSMRLRIFSTRHIEVQTLRGATTPCFS